MYLIYHLFLLFATRFSNMILLTEKYVVCSENNSNHKVSRALRIQIVKSCISPLYFPYITKIMISWFMSSISS